MLAELVVDATGLLLVLMFLSISVLSALKIRRCRTERKYLLLLYLVTGLVNALGFGASLLRVFGVANVIPALGRPGAVLLAASLLFDVVGSRHETKGC